VTHLNAGHYTDPAGDNALEDYRRVLELDPGNLLATRGIEALLGRLVRWGRVAESRGDWEAAVDYYQAAVHIDPESDELQSALRRTRRLNNTGLIQGG
jgi:tetratricopeptide (TPR) repeat protein